MIYIIKHRQYANPIIEFHKELLVGDLFENKDQDNINDLNLYMNELTGLYHMWKNTKDEIIGLCHYRRYFINKRDYVKEKDVKEILKDYDIIITPEVKFNMTLYFQLKFEVENSYYLDKYLKMYYDKDPGFKDYIEGRQSFSNREMFISKRDVMEKYCKDVFDIVIPIVKEFIKEDYKHCNIRLISHIAERYFYYWILKNNLKIYNMGYEDI